MFNTNMTNKAYCNTDGDFLICPQTGILDVQTEMGKLFVQPGEIMVVQRGVRFSVNLAEGQKAARGYITEVWGSMWELPDLGPLGGHGLANARDFLHPVAFIDDDLHVKFDIVMKNNGRHIALEQDHSPYDVVAWVCLVSTEKSVLQLTSSSTETLFLTSTVRSPPGVVRLAELGQHADLNCDVKRCANIDCRFDEVRIAKCHLHRSHRPFDQHGTHCEITRSEHATCRLFVVRTTLGCCHQHVPLTVFPPQLSLGVPCMPVRRRPRTIR